MPDSPVLVDLSRISKKVAELRVKKYPDTRGLDLSVKKS